MDPVFIAHAGSKAEHRRATSGSLRRRDELLLELYSPNKTSRDSTVALSMPFCGKYGIKAPERYDLHLFHDWSGMISYWIHP